MSTRQAIIQTIFLLSLLAGLAACSSIDQPSPTPSPIPPTATQQPQATQTSLPPTVTLTPTLLACISQPGRVESGQLDNFKPPQKFFIYLPPCYDEETTTRYPVLYLLNGQTYNDDQWIRLGAPRVLDNLIHSGESIPFIIVFPDDRYWNLPAGTVFGVRLINDIIPHIDETYRTIPNRNYRAIGGMSRGAGWALQLGLSRWDLFSVIGLHSLAVLQKDEPRVPRWLDAIPVTARPSIFMDIGDQDQELLMAQDVEAIFNKYKLAHEWHLYSGAHTEEYWSAHVEEYIRWYAEQWNVSP